MGQVLMPWLAGNYEAFDSDAFARAERWVDSVGVGGIVISIGSPLDIAAKLNQLQRRSRLPLLITADLEYGTAMRLVGGTAFPEPMAFGATGRELDAYELGRVTAIEARAVGIQMTFSPVGDLNSNPLNPIINTRSFGEDPDDVSRLISAYIRGASEHGLFTTVKHFPGHGDVGVDSHLQLPVEQGCWNRLDTLELVPFRAAIQAGATAVMVAHILFPCFEHGDSLPATLSRPITTGILRDSLGFKGLIVTDALTMGAIVNRYGAGQSAVKAFLAGSDILLMPANLDSARAAMLAALAQGRVTQARLDSSVRRILDLKVRAGLFRRRTVVLDSIPYVVGQQAFQDLADDIARRSLTLVTRGPLEAVRAHRGRMALITYADEFNQSIGDLLTDSLRAEGDTVTPFRIYPPSGPASYDSARAVIARNPVVVFATGVRPIAFHGNVALPDSLAGLMDVVSQTKPTVLVSFGSPYLQNQLPSFGGAYLLAWSDVPATERAVADALTGQTPITGRSPVALSPGEPRGTGIMVLNP